MKASQQVTDEYVRCYAMWVRIIEHQKLLMELKQALECTSLYLGQLAVPVGILQQIVKCDGVSNTEAAISRQYKHVLLALEGLRRACAPLNPTLGSMAPPPQHLLDGIDLYEGAVLCGWKASLIEVVLKIFELGAPRAPRSTISIYPLMVRVGKQLGLGYDSQTKILAPLVIPRYETMSEEMQHRKRGTLEKKLKGASQVAVGADGEVLIRMLPVADALLSELRAETAPLDWILCGLPSRSEEDDE